MQNNNNDLENIEKRLKQSGWKDKTREKREEIHPNKNKNVLSLALRVAVELVSAVAVGSIFGYWLDFWFETKPWLLILFIVLGSIAGMLNIYRLAKGFTSNEKL